MKRFRPNFFFRLLSADTLVLFGDAKTKFRIGGGPVQKLAQTGSYNVSHLINSEPAWTANYPNGWDSAKPNMAGINFPCTVEVEYASGTKNAGVAGNVQALSGTLPVGLERWTVFFVNNVVGCPISNWNAAGVSSAGITNWNAIKGGLKHVFLQNNIVGSGAGGFGWNAAALDNFSLSGNDVLESYTAHGMPYSPFGHGIGASSLRYIKENLNYYPFADNQGNSIHYFDGIPDDPQGGPVKVKLDLGFTLGEMGYALPNPNVENNITLPFLGKLIDLNVGPAYPGAIIYAGMYGEGSSYAADLTARGYDVQTPYQVAPEA